MSERRPVEVHKVGPGHWKLIRRSAKAQRVSDVDDRLEELLRASLALKKK